MVQKHRILTNIGKDRKITVELKQDYDLLEILSLKFTQKEIYTSLCSDYGVVCGRISANNGLGIPNAKISIFIPLSDDDTEDPVISALYPYKLLGDRNEDNYRYNLLPSRKQHGGHVPTGTFPDQSDILNREEVLEVYEKYYNYTVKTNSAGDFMIWGVPIGNQTIHVDVDLSDMGCFSLRPFDFLRKGAGEADFDRFYNFKSSSDIDGLPQIVTFEKTIEVYPFWGNQELCEIGITRTDFDLSERGIQIEPVSLILASSITDENSHAIKRNGKIRKNSGFKCNLQTSEGTVECVRFTGQQVLSRDETKNYPDLEYFEIAETFDQDGSAMIVLPMNLDYVYTNEFGEQVVTNDSNKGVPTSSIARFRFSLSFSDRKVTTANYLVPNIREFNPNLTQGLNNKYEYYESMVSSYIFSDVFEDYISPLLPTGTTTLDSSNYTSTQKAHKENLILGNDGVPQDYFYKFIYGKVYTVSSFQGTYYETMNIPNIAYALGPIPALVATASGRKDSFLGIKEIRPNTENECSSKTNYFPVNFAFKNRVKFGIVLATAQLFLQFIFAIITVKVAEVVGRFFWAAYSFFYNIKILGTRLFRAFAERCKDLAYSIQAKYTMQLPLTIYPDCEECTSDDEEFTNDFSSSNDYCRVAEVLMDLEIDRDGDAGDPYDVVLRIYDSESGTSFNNQTTDATFLTDDFPGEFAREGDGPCSGTTVINYFDLDDLDSQTTSVPFSSNNAKYYIEVYPLYSGCTTGTSFNPFILFLKPGGNVDEREFVRGGSGDNMAMRISRAAWLEIAGVDPVDVYNETLIDQEYGCIKAVVRIYDRSILKNTTVEPTELTIEEGCEKYDTPYDESYVRAYFFGTGSTYGNLSDPELVTGSTYQYSGGYYEWSGTTGSGASHNLLATLIGNSSTQRLPRRVNYVKITDKTYDRKTRSGLSEIRDGVFTIIPVINGTSFNATAILEWYRRKRIGLNFCGGVINYSFIDNWLHGILYFFKFDRRLRWDNESTLDLNQRGSKFVRELIFFNIFDKKFYYRSTPYNATTQQFIGQTYFDDNTTQILHPTTFYDVGVRDEFFKEICTDPMVDPTCSVIRDIGATSYQDPANIVEYNINYRLDVADGEVNVDDFFDNTGYTSKLKVLDGDMIQMFSMNSEAGIEAFDTDSQYYFMYQGEYLDPENTTYKSYFTSGGTYYGPVPIDLKLDNNGEFIRSCLNYRLGDYSQVVPFYLWDKKGIGFGLYNANHDKQMWDRTKIASAKLQRIYSVSSYSATTTNYNFNDGEEEYLLLPMTITHNTLSLTGNTVTDNLERFDIITSGTTPSTAVNAASAYTEGNLWLVVTSGTTQNPASGTTYVVVNKTWVEQSDKYVRDFRENFIYQTQLNYSGNKQVLSTPFLFYFGLTPQKTAVDKLIKYFGPKGAFTSS